MINPEHNEDLEDNYRACYSKILSLQSSLQARLNLLNIFRHLVNHNHKPLTLENINVDIKSEESIERFMLSNTNYVEYIFSKYMEAWFLDNGSEWQKKRVLEDFKRKKEGE